MSQSAHYTKLPVMKALQLLALIALAAAPSQAQETGGELAKIKEQELEEVRERMCLL